MQRTLLRERSRTEEDALCVGRRILGDLLSIHGKFGIETEAHMRALAHDVSLGLVFDCLNKLSVFLYAAYCSTPAAAYIYSRVAPGSFEASPHSGRIQRDSRLIGGWMKTEISIRHWESWNALAGVVKLPWSSCLPQSTAGMVSSQSGGYASGNVGMSRTHFVRRG